MMIKGVNLNVEQRKLVLAAFVYRHTVENAVARGVDCVNCANIPSWPYEAGQALPGGPYTFTRDQWHAYHTSRGAQVVTDAEWLAVHAFHFTKDGSRLMVNRRYAESVTSHEA